MEFLGYARPDGSAGARNYVAVIPAVQCGNELADRIATEVGRGVVALTHNAACVNIPSDKDMVHRTLVGLGCNPNVAATVVVGIGCDGPPAPPIAEEIAATSKKPVELITIDREGTYENAVAKGVHAARQMLADALPLRREPFDISYLTFASKCTGSTPASIMACNPAVGWAADALVAAGGTFIFSETTEIIGAEHLLAQRAVNAEVAERIIEMGRRLEERILATGVDIRGSQPNPGNIRGGMSTLEEKSLGAIAKSGSSPISGVLEWSERPAGKGMYFMDGAANTPQIFLGFAAGGAQVMSLNYGAGLPTRYHNYTCAVGGIPTVPVLKLFSSPQDVSQKEYFDVYAGTIIEGTETVADVGQRLLEELVAIASGKPARQEMNSRYHEPLIMYYTGPIL
ncbi:MAG: UxaA family hydrolase [Dehalococcoidia bacterium]|nr:UxaA family hydrolase [Dehalococcoidia bacterium]